MKRCNIEKDITVGCYCPYCGNFQKNDIERDVVICIRQCESCEEDYILSMDGQKGATK